MENYFDSEIKRLDRELLQLATAAQKSAAQVPTTFQRVAFSVPLSLTTSGYDSSGMVEYRIIPEKDALLMVTLDHYYDDIMANHTSPPTTRIARLDFGKNAAGNYIAKVYITGNNSDTQTIKGGGSVTVTGTMTVRCTDNFTVEAI